MRGSHSTLELLVTFAIVVPEEVDQEGRPLGDRTAVDVEARHGWQHAKVRHLVHKEEASVLMPNDRRGRQGRCTLRLRLELPVDNLVHTLTRRAGADGWERAECAHGRAHRLQRRLEARAQRVPQARRRLVRTVQQVEVVLDQVDV